MNIKALKAKYLLVLVCLTFSLNSCKQKTENREATNENIETGATSDSLFFKLSLAEWSLHEPIQNGDLDPMDFAEKANEMGFSGIEYVTSFYAERIKNAEDPEAEMKTVLDSLNAKSKKFGVKNLLLMVDGEGDLAINDSIERNKAVENHKKWIDAAQTLGCHSIRVNLFGGNEPEEWKNNSIDALKKLSEYAAPKNVNVLVENHGYLIF